MTWRVASSQLMSLPLCQILSVLLMAIRTPWRIHYSGRVCEKWGTRSGLVTELLLLQGDFQLLQRGEGIGGGVALFSVAAELHELGEAVHDGVFRFGNALGKAILFRLRL